MVITFGLCIGSFVLGAFFGPKIVTWVKTKVQAVKDKVIGK